MKWLNLKFSSISFLGLDYLHIVFLFCLLQSPATLADSHQKNAWDKRNNIDRIYEDSAGSLAPAQGSDSGDLLEEDLILMSPQAQKDEFNEYLHRHKSYVTYSQYQIHKIKKNPYQEARIFSLTDLMEADTKILIRYIESLEGEQTLSLTSLKFLRDLSEKMLSRNLKAQERTFFKGRFCKTASLTSDDWRTNCKKINIDLKLILQRWPAARYLAIESRSISLDEASFEVDLNSAYHWKVISDSHKSFAFYGSYLEFLNQEKALQPLIEGDSDNYTVHFDPSDLPKGGRIYFSEGQIKPLEPRAQSSALPEWISENRNWLAPLGLVILGGIVLESQGKNLVITSP